MQALLEQNGKPCCLNLITENDNKFLRKLDKEARKEKQMESIQSDQPPATGNSMAKLSEQAEDMTEEQKAQFAAAEAERLAAEADSSEEDEVGALI